MEEKKQLPKIAITPDVAKGTYSNRVLVSHSPSEVVLDFAQQLIGPDPNDIIVRDRIIMSPLNAKQLLMALNDNIQKYEKQFGTIEMPTPKMVQGDTVPYDILGKA